MQDCRNLSTHSVELFKSITKDNPIYRYLEVYLLKPESIDSITKALLDLSADIRKNVPIILNDLRDYMMLRVEEHFQALGTQFKTQVIALKNSSIRSKIKFISKNWKDIAVHNKQLPAMYSTDHTQDCEHFVSKPMKRLGRDIEELDRSELKVAYVSDYWKAKHRLLLEFLDDLQKPLVAGRFGMKYVNRKIHDIDVFEQIPFVKKDMTPEM